MASRYQGLLMLWLLYFSRQYALQLPFLEPSLTFFYPIPITQHQMGKRPRCLR
uniref:Uncharacterized protein n=1 Tax=Aegilops tauschii subsp. strangulata TaxID=200361 RepID=A0A453QU40_AEGTS